MVEQAAADAAVASFAVHCNNWEEHLQRTGYLVDGCVAAEQDKERKYDQEEDSCDASFHPPAADPYDWLTWSLSVYVSFHQQQDRNKKQVALIVILTTG